MSGRDLSLLSATGQLGIVQTKEIGVPISNAFRLFSSDQFQESPAKIALLRPQPRDVKKPRGRVSRRRKR